MEDDLKTWREIWRSSLETKNGLHLQPEIRRRRAFDNLLPGPTQKDGDRLQEEYGKNGTRNPLQENQNSLHPERQQKKETQIDNISVEISAPIGKAKYLGQTMTFGQHETIQIKNSIRIAWPSFAKHRQALTSRSYLLRHRPRFFDAAITPSMFHGAGTLEHENMSRSTQRKMLRPIVQTNKYTNKNKEASEEEDMTDDEATVTGRSQNQKRQQARVLDTTITEAFLSKTTLTTT